MARRKPPVPEPSLPEPYQHPLVHNQVKSTEPKPLVCLVGYPGPVAAPNTKTHVRLYTDLTFGTFYDILEEEIVGMTPTVPGDEYSARKVYVYARANVSLGRTANQPPELSFLLGTVTGEALAAMTAPGVSGAATAPAAPGGGTVTVPAAQALHAARAMGVGPATASFTFNPTLFPGLPCC